ncbi:GNAT family N-acetyltransferase [Geodermatophilus sp. SYSU D01176]
MTASEPPARPATRADRSHVVHVLADAFADDPVFEHMLPHGIRRREERIRRLFGMDVRRSTRLGGAWISSDGAAAAVWYPPGTWRPSSWEALWQTPTAIRVFGAQAAVASRVLSVMQEHHPQRPHWYLYYLGTESRRRGAGIGAAVMRPVLARCDGERLPAYLEATSERNRSFYLRHGFVDVETLVLPDDGPVLHAMWREPQ